MDSQKLVFCLVILFLALIKGQDIYTNEEPRHFRKSNRKIYSGSKPEPIRCTNEGLQADLHDCVIFYRCVKTGNKKYSVYRFQCAPGTVYDPEIEACNHPRDTKRSECGGLIKPLEQSNSNEIEGEIAEFPSPITTLKPIYTERPETSKSISAGTKNEITTTSTHSHATTEVTKTNIASEIIASQYPSTASNPLTTSNKIYYSPIANAYESTTKRVWKRPTTPAAETRLPSSKKDICSSDGFMGDSENCRKFYRCVGNARGDFMQYEFSCSESTVWDEELQSCNHPWAVKRARCGRSNLNTEKSDSNIIISSKEPSKESIKDSDTDFLGHIQIQNTETAHKEIKGQTNSGHVTSNSSSPTVAPTTSTQAYYNYVVNYTTTQSRQMKNKITVSESASDRQDNNVSKKKMSSTSKSVIDYGNNCKKSGFMRDKIDCRKFYRCVDNGRGSYIKYEYYCGEGTLWDSYIESCNHAWAVKDCNNTAGPFSITTAASIIQSNNFAQSTSTQMPIVDTNMSENVGYGITQFQSTTSLSPSTSTQATKYLISTTTNNERTTKTTMPLTTYSITNSVNINETKSMYQDECLYDGFISDKNDCKIFYRCIDDGNGKYSKIKFKCGDGTVWDSEISACNHQWAVKKCGANILTEDGKTENTGKTSTFLLPTTFNPTSAIISNPNQEDLLNIVDYDSGYGISSKEPIHSSTLQSTTESAKNNILYNNTCKDSGYMNDKNNCKKFYRCVDDGNGSYTRFEFTCGEGTVWDPETEACNHVWAVKNCGYNDISSVDTAQSSAQNGKLTTTTEEAINQHTTVKISTSHTETTPKTSMYSTTSIVEENTNYATENIHKCRVEGFQGHPKDCKKFYRCVDDGKAGFIKYDFTCGDGTLWNDEIKACDHEYNSHKCFHNIVTTSTDKTTSAILVVVTSTSHTQEEQAQITETVSQSGTFKCSSDGFFANPFDCKKFVRCVSNGKGDYTKYHFTCGEGTVWIQDIQACDHDNKSESCKSQIITTNIPMMTASLPSFTEKPHHNNITTITPQISSQQHNDEYHIEKETISSTNDICVEEGFHGSKYNCRTFYRCVDNGHNGFIKYEFMCGEGTAWDDDIKGCNHVKDTYQCKNYNQTQNEPIYHDDDKAQSTTSDTSSTTGITNTTTTISTTISTSTEQTNIPVNTQDISPSKGICESEGYFGDNQDCKFFYRCVDDGKEGFIKYEYTCGEGTIWDQDITSCNHPHNVVNRACKQNQENTQSSSSSSIATDSNSIENATESNQGSCNCSQDGLSSKPEDNKVRCEKAGYYPDPNNCKKFYRCVDWDGDGTKFSVFHFTCGEGTVWDPVVETCNHEHSVYPPRDCSTTHSQNGMNQANSSNQQTTTSHSSTEPINTSEQTTTDSTTTSQQVTTTEQTTSTHQATTKPSTTKPPTTVAHTTTTKQTTIQVTSTSETTAQPTTTNEGTTQSPSSSEQTTERTSTSEQTTQESSTSLQTTTSEHTTLETSTSEQTTSTEQMTTKETTSKQTTQPTESTTNSVTTVHQTTSEQISLSTTDESITTIESIDSTTTEQATTGAPVNRECPETEDDQYLFVCPTSFKRHPKYCNMFYQCTEDDDSHEVKIATFTCPNNTIYDETKIQCVEEKKADKKCNGEKARIQSEKRRAKFFRQPIILGKYLACPTVGHYTLERDVECSPAFLSCNKTKSGKLQGYIHQCPPEYVYWSISRRCEKKQNVRDCLKSRNDWSNRWEIPTDSSNIAP